MPEGTTADGLADRVVNNINGQPAHFAQPPSPWQNPSNKNTNALIQKHLHKGTELTGSPPPPDSSANEC